jgi:hypothetical protein
VSITNHYPASARHFLMAEAPDYADNPVNSALRFNVRGEKWLFEGTPERLTFKTARTFIKSHESD